MDPDKAAALDKQDDLACYRQEFYLKEGIIYMDGNSLGLPSKRTEAALLQMLEAWKEHGIDGWTKGDKPWYYLSETLGGQSAFLVGAKPHEVIVTGSTTVNLHQLAASFFKPEGKRTKILADELNFPSDIYALQSQLSLKGLNPDTHLVKVKSKDGQTLDEDEIIACMTEDVAMAVLPTVLYRSGQLLDIERLTKAAHERGLSSALTAAIQWGPFLMRCTNGGLILLTGATINMSMEDRVPQQDCLSMKSILAERDPG